MRITIGQRSERDEFSLKHTIEEDKAPIKKKYEPAKELEIIKY